MIDLVPLGDRAWLARFAREVDAQHWGSAVRACGLAGVVDVAVAYRSAAVFADPDRVDLDDLEARLRRIEPNPATPTVGRLIRVPVVYDGADLDDVALWAGITPAEVIAHHASVEYAVYAVGFLPGFPYAGYLPPPLAGIPRRDRPRSRVPAGSVAIAADQTGIYPGESPGGWHLIGRTTLRIVDLEAGYFAIRAGDCLRFEPIDLKTSANSLNGRIDLAGSADSS